MKTRRAHCVLLAVLVLSFVSAPAAAAEYSPEQTAPIAKFSGSWYEIGRQIGRTYPEHIISFANTMGFVLVFAGPQRGWTAERYYSQIEPVISQSIKDHMQGMAQGLTEVRPLGWEQAWHAVLTQNFAIDLINMNKNMDPVPSAAAARVRSCTAFAVASDNGTYLCHNADATMDSAGNSSVIMYWEPDNGDYAYMTMDPPGWADVAFGLNEKGIGVTYNAGNPNLDADIGLPGSFMLRSVMEQAATLAEAVGFFQDFLDDGHNFGTGGELIHIVDFKDNSMAKIQLRSHVLEVTYGEDLPSGLRYLASANHFVGDFNPDPEYYYESSFKRYERLLELIGQTAVFDLEACWRVLSDTSGGEANANTISRVSDSGSMTVFGTVFTAEGYYYTIGPPHLYLKKYGQPQFVGFGALARSKLAEFVAVPASGRTTLTWQLNAGSACAGFNLHRATAYEADYQKINDTVIAASENSYTDVGLANRTTYFYRLEMLDQSGGTTMHGTIKATPRMFYALFP